MSGLVARPNATWGLRRFLSANCWLPISIFGTCGSGDGSDGTGGSIDDDTSGSSGGGTDASGGSGGDTAGSGGSGTNGGTSGSEASGTSGSDGIVGNDPSGQYPTIRLWADSSKTTLAGTWDPCFGLELPDGVTSVWVEGTEYGEDTIQVWWEPEEVSNCERPSVYQGKQIALGSVLVEVAQPPWGTLKIEESYWGTLNKWFRTNDDNILWQHNSHQASFKTPADYDLSSRCPFCETGFALKGLELVTKESVARRVGFHGGDSSDSGNP